MKSTAPKKLKKFPLIKLEEYRTTYGDVIRLKDALWERFVDAAFSFKDMQSLIFYALKQISPINRSVKEDEGSIEKASLRVINHFKYSPKGQTATAYFRKEFVEIDTLPNETYRLLYHSVQGDLQSISELIAWYEEQDTIKAYLKSGEIPKSHLERMEYDFYKRCVDERVKILNYMLFKLKDRALEKSRYNDFKRSYQAYLVPYLDRPYEYARPFSLPYFDFRKLDLSGHRLMEFNFGDLPELCGLYSKNKARFYRIYFRKIPVSQHFKHFYFILAHVPLENDRKSIFEELERLIKARRWIGFYALALPQIEGIFSEMFMAIFPEKDLSQKSLTYKVNSIRPHYYSIHFDYFQYHIPLLRNKFSHTGFDEDFKIKSFDLVADLYYLLGAFYELDNPLVKIQKLHTRKDPNDFISLVEFSEYFKLLGLLKPSQKSKIKNAAIKFEKEFLNEYCSVGYICYELMQQLPLKLDEVVQYININFSLHYTPINFEETKIKDINELLKEERYADGLREFFMHLYEQIEYLENCQTFLDSYHTLLPNLREDIKSDLAKVKSKNKDLLHKVIYINNKLKD